MKNIIIKYSKYIQLLWNIIKQMQRTYYSINKTFTLYRLRH